MEKALHDLMELKTLKDIPCLMTLGQGFISECKSFQSEKGKFFVKMNNKSKARIMFEGEKAGLDAILATGLVRCPKPIEIYDIRDSPGSIFVLEYMELRDLDRYAATLGEAIARLHLYNSRLKMKEDKHAGRIGGVQDSHPSILEENGKDEEEETQRYVSQFGFHTTTSAGYFPLDNTWSDNWMNFYVRQRLKPKIDYIERKYGDRVLIELWPRLLRVIPRLYRDIDPIVPALLHGDLHGGNVAETMTGPVTYDPACLYGHHELDLAETRDFVDFNQDFYPAYHRLVPKAAGFDEREKLYKIFHYLNNWSHFGPKYKDKIMTLIGELVE